jgi:capsular polysaccharide biosynthesis protein
MFPTQNNSISKALLNENTAGKEDILKFGEEEEAEQMLQILNSDEIRGKITAKYNLMAHYDVDTSSKFKNTLLFKEFEDNISFERTEFMSVKITVLDKDPLMAANICNDIASLLDSVKNKMQHNRAVQGLKIVEKSFNDQKAFIKFLEDSLTKLREMGINDYETQAQAFNEQYALAIAKGNSSGMKSLEEKLKILSQYGGAYVSLREKLEHEIKQLSLIKAKYEEAKIDAEQNISAKFIVNSAYKAEKKSYPIRWLLVTISTVSSLILALLIIMLIENIRNLKSGNQIKA